MDTLFINRHLMYEIIMNMDLLDLYQLYHTNHTLNQFIDDPYILSGLNEKYHQKSSSFIDLVWQ